RIVTSGLACNNAPLTRKVACVVPPSIRFCARKNRKQGFGRMNQPQREFDQIDLRILEVLQRDGRISNADLADKVGLSCSPCVRRMRALEEQGVISGYRADLDPVQLGLTILAFVEVRISRHGAGTAAIFREAMMKERMVVGCYMVTGGYDFLLKV